MLESLSIMVQIRQFHLYRKITFTEAGKDLEKAKLEFDNTNKAIENVKSKIEVTQNATALAPDPHHEVAKRLTQFCQCIRSIASGENRMVTNNAFGDSN